MKTHHSNIALLSVAPSKRVLKSTAALVAQTELGYKNKFPNQLPPKPQPSQAAKFRKRLQLTEGVMAFPLRWKTLALIIINCNVQSHPLKSFPAARVLCDRDCYQTYLSLIQQLDLKREAVVIGSGDLGPYSTKNLNYSQQQIKIYAFAKAQTQCTVV